MTFLESRDIRWGQVSLREVQSQDHGQNQISWQFPMLKEYNYG